MLQKAFDRFVKLGCRWRYGRLLSAYLDTELNAHSAEAVAAHLRECGRCRVELEQLRFANRALLEFEIPPTRGPLSGGLVFQLPSLKRDSPLKRLCSQNIAVPLPLAAGVAIALISATWFAIGREQPAPIPSTVSVHAPSSEVIKVVEVPVERVVTRTVYSRRFGPRRVRAPQKENRFSLTPPDSKPDIAQTSGRTVEWSDSTLKEFRPASSANLRVVKEHKK